MLDKLNAIWEGVLAGIESVQNAFAWLYDKVVGNSWVPDMIEEIKKEFAKLETDMVKPAETATRKVESAFAQMFSNIGGMIDGPLGAFLQPIIGALAPSIGKVIGGIFSKPTVNLPAKADGGPVTGGMPHMVGEEGAEIFVPDSNGTIIPNHELGGASNISVQPVFIGVDAQIQQKINQSLPAIVNAATNGVANAMNRGDRRFR